MHLYRPDSKYLFYLVSRAVILINRVQTTCRHDELAELDQRQSILAQPYNVLPFPVKTLQCLFHSQ